MYDLINPYLNLATANVLAMTRFALSPEWREHGRVADLWQTTMSNHARFFTDYTTSLLGMLAQQRVLLSGQLEKISAGTERVATEMAHTAVRSVAIATQARHNGRDRRVIQLPAPAERRRSVLEDRRLPLVTTPPPPLPH